MLTAMLGIVVLVLVETAWRARGHRARAAAALVGALLAAFGVLLSLPDGPMRGKIIGSLAMPTGLVWLGMIGLTFLQVHRRDRVGAAIVGVLLVAYTLAGNSWLGATLLARLETPYVAIDPSSEGPFDAVFVLGGGTRNGPDGRPQIAAAGDRVMVAARMYHAGRTPILVASGSSTPGAALQENGATTTSEIWRGVGVPDSAIELLAEPHNTRTEIAAYAALSRTRSWHNVGLVTSAWHLPRAMALAEREGIAFVALPADFRGMPGWGGFESLIPQAGAFELVHHACWERLGAATGR